MSTFRRRENQSTYRRIFYFVTEGAATEQAYLKIVWNRLLLRERCTARFCHEKSSIPSMLSSARKIEKDRSFKPRKGDEIWIILDLDEESHFPEQFAALAAWEKEQPYRHVAITTPRFEYWLLMHLDERPSKEKCMLDDYMEQRIPYFKNLPLGTTAITKARIEAAMERANSAPIPCCDNPSIVGSGLGKLIQRLTRQ